MSNQRVIIIRNAYEHDFGGGERFPVFLAETLRNHDWQPFIISRNPRLLAFASDIAIPTVSGWWWSAQNWSGWRMIFFPVYGVWQAILYMWYRRIFARLKPAVVHIQSKDDFIAATHAAKASGARVIWTDHADLKHNLVNITKWYKNPIGKMVARTAKKADYITVVSRSELEEVTKNLLTTSPIREKIVVVYNGCSDVLSRHPATTKDDVFTFVFAGRIVTDKGVAELLSAFKQLHDTHPKTRLLVAGDGPERLKFEKLATEKVTFLGHQSDPYSIMQQGDVFVQPAYHEGFSVALVEASMLARPIIATSVGGNNEIIKDHETGLLVPPRDADALLRAMELLYSDTSLRDAIGLAARVQYKQRFVFDTIVTDEFLPLYRGDDD